MPKAKGFTLIELMIALSILAILSAIVLPMFANVTRKSREAVTKVHLGVLRSALALYYGDTEGQYPHDHLESLVPRYLTDIPMKDTPPYHPRGNSVGAGTDADEVLSHGDWFYFNQDGNKLGMIVVNCVHQDVMGVPWTTY